MMKPRLGVLFAFFLLAGRMSAAVVISNFGSDILPADLAGSWTGNYASGTSTLSGSATDGPGSGIQDFTGPVIGNVSGLGYLSLTANVAVNPATNFVVRLYDTDGDFVSANFNWSAFVGGSTLYSPLSSNIQFDGNAVLGWEMVTGGLGSPLSVSFSQLQATAIPEPSTGNLLLWGTGSMIFLRLVRGRKSIRPFRK